jgi:GTPase
VTQELVIPYDRHAIVAEVHDAARVLSEEYDATGTHLQVRAWPESIERIRQKLVSS